MNNSPFRAEGEREREREKERGREERGGTIRDRSLGRAATVTRRAQWAQRIALFHAVRPSARQLGDRRDDFDRTANYSGKFCARRRRRSRSRSSSASHAPSHYHVVRPSVQNVREGRRIPLPLDGRISRSAAAAICRVIIGDSTQSVSQSTHSITHLCQAGRPARARRGQEGGASREGPPHWRKNTDRTAGGLSPFEKADRGREGRDVIT